MGLMDVFLLADSGISVKMYPKVPALTPGTKNSKHFSFVPPAAVIFLSPSSKFFFLHIVLL
jgi:hypothetical protein